MVSRPRRIRKLKSTQRSAFHHHFVPGYHNEYKPHFLRFPNVALTSALVVLLFFLTVGIGRFVLQNPSPQMAAVIASVLVELTNGDRQANSLGVLTVSPTLEIAAQMKANDMAAKSYFAHNTPEGNTPWYWFKKAGYDYSFAGENLAVYFADSSEVEKAWMNSPSHRANILNGHFTEIGIGLAKGFYQGHETVFVVQLFARPAALASAAIPAASPLPLTEKASDSVENVQVAGANDEVERSSEEVIVEDETFIAIKKETSASPAVAEGDRPIGAITSNERPSLISRLFTAPKTLLQYLYTIIGIIVAMALTLYVGIEIRKKSPLHVAYGVFILVLMGGLLYVGFNAVSGPLLIT